VETKLEFPLRLAANPSTAAPAVILRTADLKRSFGKVHAVQGLDLTVRAGEIFGFLGINGAGKTTTIRMLMGIIRPDGGTIELLGQQARRTTLQQKQSIGYVSQEQTFYPWMTCRALGRFVGGFYPTWDAQEFDRLLRVLDVPQDRRASHLSGGMRLKLALALALAPRPALLLLDEPTSGLDPVARREFLDIIRQQARDHRRTTFFSSHIIGEVERVADRVGIIHRGRMRYEGDLADLRATVRLVRVPMLTQTSLPPPSAPATESTSLPEAIEAPPVPTPHPAEAATVNTDCPAPVLATNEPPAAPSLLEPIRLPPLLQPFIVPGGFEVLRDTNDNGTRSLVLKAAAETWASFSHPEAEVSPLSLEDIFLALVGTVTAAI
jgi:ABC-2 type transport system ATP-binding protein